MLIFQEAYLILRKKFIYLLRDRIIFFIEEVLFAFPTLHIHQVHDRWLVHSGIILCREAWESDRWFRGTAAFSFPTHLSDLAIHSSQRNLIHVDIDSHHYFILIWVTVTSIDPCNLSSRGTLVSLMGLRLFVSRYISLRLNIEANQIIKFWIHFIEKIIIICITRRRWNIARRYMARPWRLINCSCNLRIRSIYHKRTILRWSHR